MKEPVLSGLLSAPTGKLGQFHIGSLPSSGATRLSAISQPGFASTVGLDRPVIPSINLEQRLPENYWLNNS
jgi:hypothetical protein